MHGRVKVKTDSQKAEEKKQRRLEQLEQFKSARNKIDQLFSSIQKDENVENEEKLLKLTESLCAVQSDWTIFWRYRQLIFTKRVDRVNSVVKKRESEETLSTEGDDIEKHNQVEKSEEKDEKAAFINKLKDELYLTYRVLVQSPKSYVTWAHRRFCLRTLMSCDQVVGAEYVEKEIKLTETMLTAMTETQVEDQGRNFHCWDHRRLVLQMDSTYSIDNELKLTTKLLKSSISNFSAWHYRSNLLKSKVENDSERKSIIEKELDLIMNAIFTDPSDQSIWIYYKWIISKIKDIDHFAPILEEHDEALEDLKEEESLKLIRSITLAQIQIYEKLKLNSKIHSLASYLAENDSTRKGFYLELQKRYPL